jgi:methionine--tRNA ligase beta chain
MTNYNGEVKTVSFDDFKKLDLRIGKIITAEPVVNSEKLVKLTVDLGSEKRQIIAGIAKVYPDFKKLVNKLVPILVNLEPKILMGLESQGMLLAVDDDGKPVFLNPEKEVIPGSIIK